MGVIKKTVVLDDRIERFVRQTQAILVQAEPPVEASYSAAVNFMLLAAIQEASRPNGLSPDTREILWDFAYDAATIDELNLHERMDAVRSALTQSEHAEQSKEAPRVRRALAIDPVGRGAPTGAADSSEEP